MVAFCVVLVRYEVSSLASPREAMRKELTRLIRQGSMLGHRQALARATPAQKKLLAEQLQETAGIRKGTSGKAPKKAARAESSGNKSREGNADSSDAGDKAAGEAFVKEFLTEPDFGQEYQAWYSPALRVVEQVLPDRLEEFRLLYRWDRRKQMDVETYSIADYIMGLTVTNTFIGAEAFNSHLVAMQKLGQQVDILRTAEARLESVLTDISRELQAELLDDELASARTLLAAAHVRSAGVVAGVVLEAHLKQVADNRGVSLGRKKPMLANLNEALKEAGVYDVPQWRRLSYMTDVRNMCAHKSERDPTSDEVRGMVDEVDKIVRTVF